MRDRQTDSGEKLGIYIHIPFCRSKCDYCDFYSLAGQLSESPAGPFEGERPHGPELLRGHDLLRRRHSQLVRG